MLNMVSPLFVAILMCLVVVSTQNQPPGVPPRQQNQPHGGGGGHAHHGKPLEFASEVHNADHILEHLEKVVATKSKEEMTEEELEFHYFKLHDYDNNNKLDGVEIGKALTHFHDDNDEAAKENRKVFGDEEISNIVDAVIAENDADTDGYIEYFEFKQRQVENRDKQQQQGRP